MPTRFQPFEGWPFDRVCRFAKETGYDGVEVAPFTIAPHVSQISRASRADMVEEAVDAGVEIVGLHWLLANVRSERPLYVTHPDPQVRRDTADYFIELTRLCADLRGRVILLLPVPPHERFADGADEGLLVFGLEVAGWHNQGVGPIFSRRSIRRLEVSSISRFLL